MTTTTDEVVPPAATGAMATSAVGPASRPPASVASVGLSNRQKVAVLLAQLGTQKAAPILKEMTDDEAISLTTEMVGLPPLSTETVVEVVAEFLDRISRSDLVSQGGSTWPGSSFRSGSDRPGRRRSWTR